MTKDQGSLRRSMPATGAVRETAAGTLTPDGTALSDGTASTADSTRIRLNGQPGRETLSFYADQEPASNIDDEDHIYRSEN